MRLLFVLITLLSGCATGYVAGYQTLAGAASLAHGAREAWKVADKAQERKILDSTTTREDAEEGLARWRETSAKVDKGFSALASLLTGAYQALDAAEKANGTFDVVRWIGPVYHEAAAIAKILEVAGVRVTGLAEILALAGKILPAATTAVPVVPAGATP